MKWEIITALAILALTETCFAADPRYPDWPCAQAKVPEISLAAVWAGPPLGDAPDRWNKDTKVSALVAKLGARRTALDEAQRDSWQARRPKRPRRARCCSRACSIASMHSDRRSSTDSNA